MKGIGPWGMALVIALVAAACGSGGGLPFQALQEGPVDVLTTPTPSPASEHAPAPVGPSEESIQSLAQRAQDLIASYRGHVAFVALEAASGRGVAINWDEPFIAASVIKVFTMLAVLRDVEQGLYPLEEVQDDLNLMMFYSDNEANARLTNLVGLARVNALMQELGMTASVYSLWPGVEETYGSASENYITARDVAQALLALYQGRAFADPAMTRLALEQMRPAGEQDQLIISRYLPEDAVVAHKTGFIPPDEQYPSVLHDVGIVFPPRGDPYVIVLLTEENADHGAAYDLGAELSRLAYETFAGP